MVQDNPYLEVWRSLSLDQTELNNFCKYSRLNKLGKWSSFHMVSPQHIYNLRPPFVQIVDTINPTLSILYAFVVVDDKGGEIVYKDSEKTTKDNKETKGER